jgi:hypothetical protein
VLGRGPDEIEEREEPATADVEGLRRFLEGEVLDWFEYRKKELANRPLIREQAFGEALDPDRLEWLGPLDRKLATRTGDHARGPISQFVAATIPAGADG